MAQMDFWFELASTYSYVAAMRVEREAAARGVEVTWRPFLLGPIFAAQGWDTSPFKVYPKKGDYMWRDMQRLCAKENLPFEIPANMDGFPRHSVLAARIALVGLAQDWGKDFVRQTYQAEFARGADIAGPQVLSDILTSLGQSPASILEQATSPDIKASLRANTEEAIARGLFGAPSFTVGDELYWGNDRLEAALDWAST